jgi:negative regulator of flagellin synthesis FlgM
MAIDINSLSGGLQSGKIRNAAANGSKDEVAKKEAQPGIAAPATKGDSVQISDEAMMLSNRAQSAPDIDQDKVAAIKAAMDDGGYQIDYQALAKNIIQFESGL